MNFGFSEEQELLRKTARDFLAEQASSKRVREVMEGADAFDSALWGQLAELGWTGLALPDEYGGAGLSMVELCVVLEELGRSLAPVPFLPTVIAGTAIMELGTEAQRSEWLPGIAAGRVRATLALTEAGGRDAPAAIATAAIRDGDGDGDGDDWRLSGTKLFVPDGAAVDLLLVVARTGAAGEGGVGLFLVPADAAGVARQPMQSMDLLRPVARIDLENVRLPAGALLGGVEDATPGLQRIVDRAVVMISAEMVGGAEKCLEDSVQYAKERVQFGKPIGVNQAIKHKCADMLFQVESARSITYYAAWAACEDNDEAPLSASMAKAYASDAYRFVSAENIQIHGGVGFTWEYDCHLYFKRAKSNEAWLGDGTHHRERVATLLQV